MASPALGHLFPSDVGGGLRAGRYATGFAFHAPLSFEVPAGFRLDALREGNVAVSGASGWLGAFVADAVFPDPCKSRKPVTATTSDDLVTALRAMKGFTSGGVLASTVDGRGARSFELDNAIDTATAGCVGDLMLPLFRSVGNPDGEATNGGTHQRVWVVDGAPSRHLAPSYEGPVLVVADGWASEADLDVLSNIAASLDFE